MESGPLSGLTIVEINSENACHALVCATCLAGRIASDMGARVIRAKGGADERMRLAEPQIGDVSAEYAFLYAGKTIVEADGDDLAALARAADGVLMDEGVPAITGADGPRAAAVLSMSGQQGGTFGESEFATMAACGILDLVGDADRSPLRIAGNQLGYSGGLAAYTALIASIMAEGDPAYRIARINLLDVGLWLNWKSIIMAGAMGRKQTRTGGGAEWQVLPCADGWVAIVYREADWHKIKSMIPDPELDQERFATRVQRRENGKRLAEILAQGLRSWTREQIKSYSTRAGIPFGPVWSPRELLDDEQNASRNFFLSTALGPDRVIMPRLPLLWNAEAFAPREIPRINVARTGRGVTAA